MTTKEQLDEEHSIVLKKLARLAEQRQRVEAEVRSLRRQQDALVVEGLKAGVPKLTLSNVAKLTRQTIYAIDLREKADGVKAVA